MDIATSHLPADKLAAAKSKWDEMKTALEPINTQALLNADEVVVTEVMQARINQILIAARLQPTDATGCERGAVQFCELISRWSNGTAAVETSRVQDATMTTLSLPKPSPYQPAIARFNDIVIVSTDVGLLHRSLGQLQNESALCKFDDPRLKKALDTFAETRRRTGVFRRANTVRGAARNWRFYPQPGPQRCAGTKNCSVDGSIR